MIDEMQHTKSDTTRELAERKIRKRIVTDFVYNDSKYDWKSVDSTDTKILRVFANFFDDCENDTLLSDLTIDVYRGLRDLKLLETVKRLGGTDIEEKFEALECFVSAL